MSAHSDHGFATSSIHAGYEPDLRLNELRGGFEYTRCQGGAGAIPSAFDAYHPADVQHALSCVDSA
ncbi:hypothetical protein [Corynebacterium diphtheriae]|uniref:hypothetical protein n=1 Tax=Corynebacterium diphtheriae TaxID=1717 RepID=UPI000925FE1E|nr:hypothetical protein [Corynebacterium diphtheriae]APM35925.1 hypothetical protein BS112_04855 [Corynebacterium diphtheriae]MBG9302541.1 hypothetical protein [Corynebacterium diphtheriae bv. mitis]MBG9304909.1 hypothetical protein [Corynebacterium diphtheriae bv. mitis]OJH87384.1 hypothetical protein BKD79_10175 [Corynebacterium diphtheriae]OJH89413.1 hypothetical protein BKD76_03655 [Corynebacterium diphtheriae]